ncbi:MAG TPA: flagellar basal body rod protein FlgB [Cyanobacteria bacterium UBA8530]|nr:flagellar basal body rod protein FlgB [Cyanobacteria bacterium UBA8530]
MDFGKDLRGLERALDGLSLRHQVRANNIANINTPGFKPSEVRFEDALLEALNTPELVSEDVQASGIQPSSMENWTATVYQKEGSQRLDGNGTSLESEMAGLSKNSLTFNAAVTVIAMEYRTLKSVIDQR